MDDGADVTTRAAKTGARLIRSARGRPATARSSKARAALAAARASAGAPGVGGFIRGRLESFRYALAGVRTLLATQKNAWIHAVATVAVVVTGLALEISRTEWALVALAVAVVWFSEAMNTAFENLCDIVSPEFHPVVKRCKDVAAGAVLLASLCAATTGLLIFGPPLWALAFSA